MTFQVIRRRSDIAHPQERQWLSTMCLRFHSPDHEELVPVAFDQGSTLLVEVSVPTGKSSLPRFAAPSPRCSEKSISTDSSTSMAQIAIEYDGVDGVGGKSVEKSSKSRRIIKKSKKPQRLEKSGKSIGLGESTFLTSNTRLPFTKIGSSHMIEIS